MALIKCPECGKEISDKAPACIHCGYPLSSTDIPTATEAPTKCEDTILYINDKEYDTAELLPLIKSNQKIVAIQKLTTNIKVGLADAKDIVDTLEKTGHVPNRYMQNLISCPACGNKMSNEASVCPHCGKPTGVNVCPKCGSIETQVIDGVSKAVSVGLFGLFAANKVMSKYECKKCGHKF